MPFGAIAKVGAKLAGKVLPGVGKAVSRAPAALVGKPAGVMKAMQAVSPMGGMMKVAGAGPSGIKPGPMVSGTVTRGGQTTAQAVAAARAMGGPGAVVVGNVFKGAMDAAGRWWSNSKIAGLVRKVGPEAAAIALGLAVSQVYQAVTENHARGARRRRRGISYREITTTRRTLTKLDRLACLARKPTTTRRKTCR